MDEVKHHDVPYSDDILRAAFQNRMPASPLQEDQSDEDNALSTTSIGHQEDQPDEDDVLSPASTVLCPGAVPAASEDEDMTNNGRIQPQTVFNILHNTWKHIDNILVDLEKKDKGDLDCWKVWMMASAETAKRIFRNRVPGPLSETDGEVSQLQQILVDALWVQGLLGHSLVGRVNDLEKMIIQLANTVTAQGQNDQWKKLPSPKQDDATPPKSSPSPNPSPSRKRPRKAERSSSLPCQGRHETDAQKTYRSCKKEDILPPKIEMKKQLDSDEESDRLVPPYKRFKENEFCYRCNFDTKKKEYTVHRLTEEDHSTRTSEILQPNGVDCHWYWRQSPDQIVEAVMKAGKCDRTDGFTQHRERTLCNFLKENLIGMRRRSTSRMYCIKCCNEDHNFVYWEIACLYCARYCELPMPEQMGKDKFHSFLMELMGLLGTAES